MKSKELEALSNNRVRSFLSPYSKFGKRSLSTSQSHPNLNNSSITENQKSYIDFRRVQRKKQVKQAIRIKIEDFSKNQCKKDQRLFKCTMNKYKQNGQRWEKHEQDGDLLKMVRQLKQRVIDLQAQNSMLRRKQQQDATKIFKQNDIIRNLEQAINLNRPRAGYSLSLYEKQNKAYQKLRLSKECVRDSQISQEGLIRLKRASRQIKLQKINNISGVDKKQQQVVEKIRISQKQKSETPTKLQLKELQYFLRQIEKSKVKQLQEIDSLLASFDI